jgi:hypothetical protein
MFPIGVLGNIYRPVDLEKWEEYIIDPTFLGFRALLRRGSIMVVEFEVNCLSSKLQALSTRIAELTYQLSSQPFWNNLTETQNRLEDLLTIRGEYYSSGEGVVSWKMNVPVAINKLNLHL